MVLASLHAVLLILVMCRYLHDLKGEGVAVCSGRTQETLRLAKMWVEEQLSRSGDGLSVGYEVYKEDARFIKELLKGQTVTNSSIEAIHAGRQQTDAQEALATPRPQAQNIGVVPTYAEERFAGSCLERQVSSPKRRTVLPRVAERPTRPWVDG
eukprot:COSAG02_NODE_1542_length_12011_cov_103.068754_7_plen_154_part_00